MPHIPRRFLFLLLAGAVAFSASACTGNEQPSPQATTSNSASSGDKIALLLPDAVTARYEQLDRPYFEEKVAALGSYEVLYSNADNDAAKQQQQAEAALVQGAKVLVLDAVDVDAALSIVAAAKAQNVPVIAYDRFIDSTDISYYISFNNEKIGTLQAQALVDELKARKLSGGIIMINGSPTDGKAGAPAFKRGAHSVIDSSGYEVLGEFDSPGWSPEKAQEFAEAQVAQFGNQIVGVYAANDGTAGGAIAAMKAANANPWPVVTGQDAELAAVQRILTGDQHMTVFRDIKLEAGKAAEVAVGLLGGNAAKGDMVYEGIQSAMLEPSLVFLADIKPTLIDGGTYTLDQICTPDYADACAKAGLR
ncbi:MAG: substrate-binding domain-containing protein [Propionibacteriaceae bacterium]|nr:substrate-binding domain-containing protein [Propionibacteriaceae bacterium]